VHREWLLFETEGVDEQAEFTKRRGECKWERDENKRTPL
jgi:hypothetical protein